MVARARDDDVSVSTEFRDAPTELHRRLSARECHRARFAETRGRIAKRGQPRDVVLALRALGDHATTSKGHNAASEEQCVLGLGLPRNGLATVDNGATQVGSEHQVVHLLERVSVLDVDLAGPQ